MRTIAFGNTKSLEVVNEHVLVTDWHNKINLATLSSIARAAVEVRI